MALSLLLLHMPSLLPLQVLPEGRGLAVLQVRAVLAGSDPHRGLLAVRVGLHLRYLRS